MDSVTFALIILIWNEELVEKLSHNIVFWGNLQRSNVNSDHVSGLELMLKDTKFEIVDKIFIRGWIRSRDNVIR